jgi:hypothetical protein
MGAIVRLRYLGGLTDVKGPKEFEVAQWSRRRGWFGRDLLGLKIDGLSKLRSDGLHATCLKDIGKDARTGVWVGLTPVLPIAPLATLGSHFLYVESVREYSCRQHLKMAPQ